MPLRFTSSDHGILPDRMIAALAADGAIARATVCARSDPAREH